MIKTITVIALLLPLSAVASTDKWKSSSYKSIESASIRPSSGKLTSFGLSCSQYTKGNIVLELQPKLAPTTPRKGQEETTKVIVEIDGKSFYYNMVNHASFPELLKTKHSISKNVINQLQKGNEVSVLWERWNGRLEVEFISLKNSSSAIASLIKNCTKLKG
ncbi:hypothetical protein [Vibrio mexicanus]|uniref:hypothetical protein n=1 Tax=Vibrio mexicanus TaxID=1004326 RepID=UPI00063C293A|nr:hypothetical protein [Vibrio mexicanus]